MCAARGALSARGASWRWVVWSPQRPAGRVGWGSQTAQCAQCSAAGSRHSLLSRSPRCCQVCMCRGGGVAQAAGALVGPVAPSLLSEQHSPPRPQLCPGDPPLPEEGSFLPPACPAQLHSGGVTCPLPAAVSMLEGCLWSACRKRIKVTHKCFQNDV